MLENGNKVDSFSREFITRPCIGPCRICAKLIIMRPFRLIKIGFETSHQGITFSFE